jgi:pantetheine-phosphate adenylyltransferase
MTQMKKTNSKITLKSDPKNNRKAVYPGSFDPITRGHVDLIERASKLFEEVIILVASSAQKQALFSTKERMALIQKSLSHLQNVRVDSFDGLTTEYMKRDNIQVLVRGLRQVEDFEYERSMAQYNATLLSDAETIMLYSNPGLAFISSRGVKEVARHNPTERELAKFVPAPVVKALLLKMKG